jgi:cobalt transporter subunit CbtA
MNLFRRMFFAAVLAGAMAGLANAAIQQWRIAPLILQAETFETADHDHGQDAVAKSNNPGVLANPSAQWQPADGIERVGLTILATTLVGVGFAFIIGAVSVMTGLAVTPTSGVLWGLAGFAAFHLAPAIGLPPELPGMPAADLTARQLWWWGTAISTGLAAYLLARFRSGTAVLVAAVLILAPHLIGAPSAPSEPSGVPAHLASSFAANTLAVALVFWLLCGTLYGWLNTRIFPLEARS